MPISVIPDPDWRGEAEALIECDFGATPTGYQTFTITDAAVVATSNVIVSQSGIAATGKSADENEMDPIHAVASPGTGSFTLWCTALQGPVVGPFKFAYVVR